MRGSVKSGRPGVSERLCDENKSGGLGKSSKEGSESAVDEDEEKGKGFGSWSKCGSGDAQGGRQVSVWSCGAGAADTQEEAGARCAGAGPPL